MLFICEILARLRFIVISSNVILIEFFRSLILTLRLILRQMVKAWEALANPRMIKRKVNKESVFSGIEF